MTFPRVMLLRNGAIVTDPIPEAVAIRASVGQGGANNSADTRAVQIALNAVPATPGGAGDSLAVDGLVGPLTVGAITRFQNADCRIKGGRCDPRGPTLALLRAGVLSEVQADAQSGPGNVLLLGGRRR